MLPSISPMCLRCKTVPLVLDEALTDIVFYGCPSCQRGYQIRPGRALAYRWGHPIGFALYGVIYAEDAIALAPRTAEQLSRSRDRAQIERFADEIQIELDEPTQQIDDIIPMEAPKSEEHLRGFLRVVAELMRAEAARRPV